MTKTKKCDLKKDSVETLLAELKSTTKGVRITLYKLYIGNAHNAYGASSFAEFAKARIFTHLSKSAYHQNLREARIEARVLGNDDIGKLSSTNLRKLDEYPAERQAELWKAAQRVAKENDRDVPTIKHIEQAAQRHSIAPREQKKISSAKSGTGTHRRGSRSVEAIFDGVVEAKLAPLDALKLIKMLMRHYKVALPGNGRRPRPATKHPVPRLKRRS